MQTLTHNNASFMPLSLKSKQDWGERSFQITEAYAPKHPLVSFDPFGRKSFSVHDDTVIPVNPIIGNSAGVIKMALDPKQEACRRAPSAP